MQATYPANVFHLCPKCGAEFSFQADNSFRCASCGFHYYINANAAVCALILDPEKRLLLTKRAHDPCRGMLDLPGGFVDPLETAEHALRRELQEELNVAPETMRYFGSFPNRYVFSGLTYFTLDLAFVCTLSDMRPLKPADDVADVVFVPPSRIDLASLAFESMRAIITAYRRHIPVCGPGSSPESE